VHFFWRAVDFPDRGFGTQSSYGLIAQEAEAVLPDLVVADAQGYRAVDYSKLPLLAIQAIRELKERNDALERRWRHWRRCCRARFRSTERSRDPAPGRRQRDVVEGHVCRLHRHQLTDRCPS
jgi:hypothetical protein